MGFENSGTVLAASPANQRVSMMSLNEAITCRVLIKQVLTEGGWALGGQLLLRPGRLNLTGERNCDESRRIIACCVPRPWSTRLAVLESRCGMPFRGGPTPRVRRRAWIT